MGRKENDGCEASRAKKQQLVSIRQYTNLVRLIDDLLDVSRVRQGEIELRKERHQATAIVDSVLETIMPLMDTVGHTLTIDIPAEPVWLDADLTRLIQIIGNLLNNAAKYTAEGGRIVLSVQPEGDMAVISVSDNGIGIPADMQPKIFQLFAQVDNHLERAQDGLALVEQLVSMHGGTVGVTSAGSGQRSVFTMHLPLAPSPEFQPTLQALPPKQRRRGG